MPGTASFSGWRSRSENRRVPGIRPSTATGGSAARRITSTSEMTAPIATPRSKPCPSTPNIGSSHHRRPRLPSSRNRPPGKNIAHMAGGVPRALRPHRRLQWADRSVEPEDQEHQAHRARIPQLRQLPAPPPSQPRPNPEQSSDITDPNPPSQLGGVEPVIHPRLDEHPVLNWSPGLLRAMNALLNIYPDERLQERPAVLQLVRSKGNR